MTKASDILNKIEENKQALIGRSLRDLAKSDLVKNPKKFTKAANGINSLFGGGKATPADLLKQLKKDFKGEALDPRALQSLLGQIEITGKDVLKNSTPENKKKFDIFMKDLRSSF